MTQPARRPRAAARVAALELTVLAVAALCTGVWLARTAVTLGSTLLDTGSGGPGAPGGLSARVQDLGIDRGVELPLAAVGATVCLYLAVHCLLGLTLVLTQAVGRPAHRLAALVARRSPGVVRAVVRRTATAGLGLGIAASAVVTGATAAGAAPLAPESVAVQGTGHEGAQVDRAQVDRAQTERARTGAAGVGDTSSAGAGASARAGAADGAGTVAPVLDLGWHATAPTPPSAAPEHPTATSTAAQVRVVVRPGDTLWSIAAAHLRAHGSPADAASVAAQWPRWYAANRTVVGHDPDLLRVGTVLVAPPSAG